MSNDSILEHFGYKVLKTIGEGSFGKVKLATSTKHADVVAIKIMDRLKMSDFGVNKLIPRELEILKTVKHPNIVKVYQIIERRHGKVYIVMAAAETDLSKKISTVGRVPIGTAKMWFSQLVSALVYLHQQGIAHRDLKCENVLLTADNQIKLSDFGLSCFTKGFPSLTNTNCGTLYYMAPEVILGRSYDPKKADVWSLGVILYKLVMGHLPFESTIRREMIDLQAKPLPWNHPRWIRAGLSCRNLISKMLEFSPHDRLSMAEVAQHSWLKSWRDRVQFRWKRVQVLPMGQEEAAGQKPTPLATGPPKPITSAPRPEAFKYAAGHQTVGEDNGCCRLRTIVNRLVAPIRRASRSLEKKMRKVFGLKSAYVVPVVTDVRGETCGRRRLHVPAHRY